MGGGEDQGSSDPADAVDAVLANICAEVVNAGYKGFELLKAS